MDLGDLRSNDFAVRCAALRGLLDLTQTDFGKLIGLTRQNVCKLERAVHFPSGPTQQVVNLLAILYERGYPIPKTELSDRALHDDVEFSSMD